jgi:hypothetical protein
MPVIIEFGALVEPIAEQLKKQGITIPEADSERFQKIAWSIILLHLHGIIPDSVRSSAQKKLMKQIVAAIEKANKKKE